jgi:hypothetical protein
MMVSTGRGGHVASSRERAQTAVPAPSGVAAVPEAVLLSDGYLVEPEPAGGAGRVARVRQDHLEDVRTEVIGQGPVAQDDRLIRAGEAPPRPSPPVPSWFGGPVNQRRRRTTSEGRR